MRRPYLLLFALAFFPACCLAQDQHEIDSLRSYLHSSSKKDTTRVKVYNQLGFLYRSADKTLAASYLDSAIVLAQKLDYTIGVADAYNRYGILYKNRQQYDKAINCYEKSIALAKKLDDKHLVADVTNNLGNVHRLKGDPIKAADAFLSGLKMREELADTQGAAAAYSNLAYLYSDQKNYALAIENNSKSIELFHAANDSFELARSYGYMGFIYYFKSDFDSAIYYCTIALNILEKLGDKMETSSLLNNMGNILAESGDPAQGISYHKKALAIQETSRDSTGIFTSYLSLAQTYLILNEYHLAEQYIEKTIDLLNRMNGMINMYMDTYLVSSQIYKAQKNYVKAYEAFEEYNKYKDSLVNENNSRAITEMQEKYDSDKKDLQIEKNRLEISNAKIQLRQKNIITAVLVSFIVVIILIVYLLYNRYKLRKKQELNEEIIRQQNIRSKAVIEAEERERTRIAKDLHDGIGQHLSAARLIAASLDEQAGGEERKDKTAILLKTLDDSIKEVRSISHDMMPNALFKLGLVSAIREFIDKISATGLMKVDMQVIGLRGKLDQTTEIILYRVMQELVNNIIKHADASSLGIQIIVHEDEMLNIMVEDDGKGFDSSQPEHFEGIGLKNIISRVAYLGGTVVFDSRPGKGTTVIIDVPLKREELEV